VSLLYIKSTSLNSRYIIAKGLESSAITMMQNFIASTLAAGDDPWIEAVGTGEASTSYQTASFYQDSSGKSTLDLPLRITFQDAATLNALLATKCIYPAPSSSSEKGEDKDESDTNQSDKNIEEANKVSFNFHIR
jgi:hypothetical protein